MISPMILGRGLSGQAIAKSFQILSVLHPEWKLEAPRWLERGESLAKARDGVERPVLAVANPHGLHARALLEADAAGFRHIICEKPACTTLEEVAVLRKLRASVAVLHGYRQMWGPQRLKSMITEGKLGDIISIEGKYWQSSTADKAIRGETSPSWKDDPKLSGPFDTLLDLGTHWADLAAYFMGGAPERALGWKSFVNSASPHRDSHVQLMLAFSGDRRAAGSFSKTVHGATNELEIVVIGARKAARWSFLSPDEIHVGEGRDRHVVTRRESTGGSRQPAFHGLGWLEGYLEICRLSVLEMFFDEKNDFPKLPENLNLLETVFRMELIR